MQSQYRKIKVAEYAFKLGDTVVYHDYNDSFNIGIVTYVKPYDNSFVYRVNSNNGVWIEHTAIYPQKLQEGFSKKDIALWKLRTKRLYSNIFWTLVFFSPFIIQIILLCFL